MSYSGDYSGNRHPYNSYRGGYRGRPYRGGRGGSSYNSPGRYQNSYNYGESSSGYYGGGQHYHANYRGENYAPQRGGYYNGGRGAHSDGYANRYEKRHNSGSRDRWTPSSAQGERPLEAPAPPSPAYEPARPAPSRFRSTESPFYYLTGLDQSSENEQELLRIRNLFKEDDSIDAKLQEQKLQLCKSELELGLLSTQCEKDALNVQLTQENLDALLLMQ